MKSFTDLQAWIVSMELAKMVYILSRSFPKDERFGLTSQVRSSCTSALANIAEGFGRYTYPDKANKYTIARGEITETEAFLLIAVELQFLKKQDCQQALDTANHAGRLLSGLIKSCKTYSH